jgi:hypothetical protein
MDNLEDQEVDVQINLEECRPAAAHQAKEILVVLLQA